ncbi:MAG: thermonuclease family protein [Chloroflexi bacterium]|nr:thermonuclease family protein [Chloroflexota bacterium]
MKRAALILALVFLLSGCRPAQGAMVVRVVDGDTIVVEGGARVRYIGMDAPEMQGKACYADDATAANERLVAGKRVALDKDTSDTDRYGRLLRYVYVDGLFVNGELVRHGYARARAYPPDVKRRGELSRLEEEARKMGRGLWTACSPPPKSRGTPSRAR